MLKSLTSNSPTFKPVHFHRGYNIILADRIHTENDVDDQKKTRNGSGKSTLIDIIHFCLGSSVDKDSIFKRKELEGWSFTLEFNIGVYDFIVERNVNTPNKMILHHLSPQLKWDTKIDKESHVPYVSIATYTEELQYLFFGFSKNSSMYYPSFRELISYYIRRNLNGYSDAFEYWKNQKTYSRQACNAYFLDLNIDFASKFQLLKDRLKSIEDYKKAVASGVIVTFTLDVGKLETEVINRRASADQMLKQLESFHVHPQYNEISTEANNLTEQIHAVTNNLILKKQLLERYEQSIAEEVADVSIDNLQRIYEEAGVVFPGNVKVRLDEVATFHKELIANRREYLQNEIAGLRSDISRLKIDIEHLTESRAKALEILKAHGALEEYTKLQEKYSKLVQLYEDAKTRLEAAQKIEDEKSKIQIETQELLLSARRDYTERAVTRERAINLFRENTEFLYQEPGILNIEIKENGYVFGVEIKSAKSQGIMYMQVLCYDLLIAELGAFRKQHPDFMVHDSIIFDGVDERQIALALQLAKQKSDEIGFQYICMMNSDMIPKHEFDKKFRSEFDNSVILRLDDSTENGGLLGIRF